MSIVEKKGECYYLLETPKFTDEEEAFLELVEQVALKEFSIQEMERIFLTDRRKGSLIHNVEANLLKFVEVRELTLSAPELEKKRKLVEEFIKENVENVKHLKELSKEVTYLLCGLGPLTPLVEDPKLEEIMVNGINKPVRVFHREKGMCKTNLVFHSSEELMVILKKIAAAESRELNTQSPLLDARLSDGSRINITVPPASLEPTLTIRKFSVTPYSIIDLVNFGTLTFDLAGFLWLAVEGMHITPMNMIIVGGSGSGKTTTLNALTCFIPLSDRVVTIEDTIELNLGKRDNWVQLESSYDYTTRRQITMDDLLKASLRMRPDRIIVGEVRGKEAVSLFTAMDVGISGSMGTLHANDAKETLLRLESPPMNVPKPLLSLLDLILVQNRFKLEDGTVIRRITQVSEVSWLGDRILLNDIFKWDKSRDLIHSTQLPPQTIEKIAFTCKISKEEVMDEIELRKRLLMWMNAHGKSSYEDVVKLVNEFYRDRNGFLRKVTSSE